MDMIKKIILYGLLLLIVFVSFSNQAGPTWILPTTHNMAVPENTPVSTQVFEVVAHDADGDAITFSDTSSNAYYQIDASGVITVKALSDYETTPTTNTLNIQATAGGDTLTANFVIDTTNVNEAPSVGAGPYTLTATEGQAYGTVLGSPGFTITDPDAGDTHICTMTCDTSGVLQMSKNAPYSVRLIREYYPFDNGQATTITCAVTVTDQGGSGVSKLTASTTLTVTFSQANNYAPWFSVDAYDFYMDYYTGSGNEIAAAGVISATDEDAGATLTYSIDQSMLAPNQDYFAIDPSSGRLTVNRAVDGSCNCPNTPLKFTVTATDGTSSKTIPITVLVGPAVYVTNIYDREWQYGFFDDPKSYPWFIMALFVGLVTLCLGGFLIYRYCCNYQKYYGRGNYHRHKERTDYDDDYYRPHKPRHESPL